MVLVEAGKDLSGVGVGAVVTGKKVESLKGHSRRIRGYTLRDRSRFICNKTSVETLLADTLRAVRIRNLVGIACETRRG